MYVHASISHTNLIKKKEMTRSSASLQHNCTSSGVHCHPCIPVLAPSEKHDDETGITELFVFVISVLGKEWGYRNTHIPSTQEIYMYLVNKHIRSVLMQYNIISMYLCVAIQCIVCTGPYITCPAPVSARPVAEGPFLSSRSFSSFASA